MSYPLGDPDGWIAEVYMDGRGRLITIYRDDSFVGIDEKGRRVWPMVTPGQLRAGHPDWRLVWPEPAAPATTATATPDGRRPSG